MAQKRRIRNCILICTYLLALPSGRDALTCCRRDLSNGSTSCRLSDDPDPTCSTEWIADGVTVVDQSGGTAQTRVQHVDPQTLVLKEKHSEVIFQMECKPPKNFVKLSCNDLCPSSDHLSTATAESQLTDNAVNKNTSDGVFILLSVIIVIIFAVS